MRLETYISDLLYRYECVIVPGFGGFITNETTAKLNRFTHTFYPPTKQITFNNHLQNNDGLLANYIASVESVTFSEATTLIKNEINTWSASMKNETIELSKIGTLSLDPQGKIIFEPSTSQNYLTDSFGLAPFNSTAVQRGVSATKESELNPVIPLTSEVTKRKTPVFLKYAASAAILFAVGSFTWNTYNVSQYNEQILAEQQQQKAVELEIQQATFVIDSPLPTITLNVTKEVHNYHIVAGAFREVENANKKVKELIGNGFKAQILGVNKWGLTQVAFSSYNSRAEAINNLKTIKKTVSSDAWLLVQKY
jgi:cell division septation protein DedD